MSRLNYLKKEARKMEVLGHIVSLYVSSAVPVSSRLVSQRMGRNISSATVRNIMAELEADGFITQPHTSAGRIPTSRGYRLYVDMMSDRIEMVRSEVDRLAAEYSRRIRTIEEVIEVTSRMISREMKNAGIVMWPTLGDYYLKRLELVKVRARTVMAILMTMTNAVKDHVVRMDKDIQDHDLDKITVMINSRYNGMSFTDISEDLRKFIDNGCDGDRGLVPLAKEALSLIDSVIEEDIGNEICWEGLNYFMEEPEFRNAGLTLSMLQIFSDKRDLVRIMRKELPVREVCVHIGEENGSNVLRECSIVTGGYEMHGRIVGRIGVIGPTRMDYGKAVRTVRCLSRLVTSKLEEITR